MDTNSSSAVLVCSNLSQESVSDLFTVSESRKPYLLGLSVLYILYLLVGLPWNVLVLGTILKQRLYRRPTIILLLNLVVTDLLILLFTLTVKTIAGLSGEFDLGNSDRVRCEVCRVELAVSSLINVSAILTISVIAFDRFFFIHKPFKYEKLISVKSSVATIIVIWFLAVVYVSLAFGILFDVILNRTLLECNWDFSLHSYFHTLSILFILLPYIFLLVCNVWVVVIVLRNIRKVYSIQKSKAQLERRASLKKLNGRMKQTRKKKQLRLMRVFGGIIVTNTLASLPLIILGFFTFEPHLTRLVPGEYAIISTALFYSQAVIHPILESTLIKEIKAPMLKLFICLRCHKKSTNGRLCCIAALKTCHSEREASCCAVFKAGAGTAPHAGTSGPSSKASQCMPTNQLTLSNQILVPIEKTSRTASQKGHVLHLSEQEYVSKDEVTAGQAETICSEVSMEVMVPAIPNDTDSPTIL